jgi:soluble lytic murein transglycosylase-like protein
MQRKLAGYILLSFLSFTVFTTFFITVVSAQVPATQILAPVLPSASPTIPTPTLQQIQQPTFTPTPTVPPVKFTLQSITLPSPTQAQPKESAQIEQKTQQPAAVIEANPTLIPTAVPTIEPTTAPLPTATPLPRRTVTAPADLEPFFAKYAGEFNVDEEDLKGIAKCEAGFNAQSDTGLYAGMFQFDSATWASTRTVMGLDPNPDLRKNAEESIRTAAYKVSHGGRHAWPNC